MMYKKLCKNKLIKLINYTHKNTKIPLGNYDTFHKPLSKEWVNGRSRNQAGYTKVFSAANLPRTCNILSCGFDRLAKQHR